MFLNLVCRVPPAKVSLSLARCMKAIVCRKLTGLFVVSIISFRVVILSLFCVSLRRSWCLERGGGGYL